MIPLQCTLLDKHYLNGMISEFLGEDGIAFLKNLNITDPIDFLITMFPFSYDGIETLDNYIALPHRYDVPFKDQESYMDDHHHNLLVKSVLLMNHTTLTNQSLPFYRNEIYFKSYESDIMDQTNGYLYDTLGDHYSEVYNESIYKLEITDHNYLLFSHVCDCLLSALNSLYVLLGLDNITVNRDLFTIGEIDHYIYLANYRNATSEHELNHIFDWDNVQPLDCN